MVYLFLMQRLTLKKVKMKFMKLSKVLKIGIMFGKQGTLGKVYMLQLENMILFSEHLSNNYKHQNEYLKYTTKNKFVKLVEKLKEEYKIISCSEKFYYSDLYDLDK